MNCYNRNHVLPHSGSLSSESTHPSMSFFTHKGSLSRMEERRNDISIACELNLWLERNLPLLIFRESNLPTRWQTSKSIGICITNRLSSPEEPFGNQSVIFTGLKYSGRKSGVRVYCGLLPPYQITSKWLNLLNDGPSDRRVQDWNDCAPQQCWLNPISKRFKATERE